MILSKKKPALLRQPVQITSDEVHLYYARPVLLGRVTRRDSRWATDDGARHESTRQALDYLAARYERGEITEWVPPAPAPRATRPKRARVSSASKLAAPVTGGSLTSPGLPPAASAGPATTTTASAVTAGGADRRVGGGVYAGPERRGGAARDLLRDVDRATVEALLVRLVELERAALERTPPTPLPEQTKLK